MGSGHVTSNREEDEKENEKIPFMNRDLSEVASGSGTLGK